MVSRANTPASTVAPTLTHGPQVAAGRNSPGRSATGAFSVSGTGRLDGAWMPKSCKVCWNELSASIGPRSTTQRPCESTSLDTESVNIQRCAKRFTMAN